jgi:hypothetical protein
MNSKKRKVSCTFKRETSLEIQERIYPLLRLWRADLKGKARAKLCMTRFGWSS